MNRMKLLKGAIARVVVSAFVLQLGTGTSHAVSIPTGSVSFTTLASVSAALATATLEKWRTGTANQAPVAAAALSFQYLASGTGLGLPNRTTVKDNSANNQNDMWSDNAIAVDYTKPNNDATAIVIYTNNTDTGALDPLSGVTLRGGLVASDRASVLPLLWKAVAETDLSKVSGADVTNAALAIPATSPLFMPTEIVSATGGACPAEGPYAASSRTNNGFCDYSTHYFLDKNNTDPGNLWYQNPQVASKAGAYHYASAVGRLGVNTTEQGAGIGAMKPAHLVLGVGAANAQPLSYASTINVEAVSF